jgi:phage-related baseplate assembly protein
VPLSLTDLTTPLTPADVQRVFYSVLAAAGVTTTTWKPGGVVRTIITGVSYVASAFSELLADLASSAFLTTSSADWLTLVAQNVYNVTRLPPTFATTAVTLVNTGGGVYTLAAGDLNVVNPISGQAYYNVSPITIGSHATVTGVVVTAFQPGNVGTSFVGEISQIQTPPTLTPVTVTNPAIAVGTDAETDQSLRQRCLDKLGSLSPDGPSDAYGFIARSALDQFGQPIGVTRVKVTNDGFGNVDVYLATAAGNVDGTVGDLTTPLGIIDDLMQRLAAPLAVTLRTHSANPYPIDVTYSMALYNTSGQTSLQIETIVNANLLAFLSRQPIGGNVVDTAGEIYVSAIEAVIGGSTTPQGVPLNPIRVIVTSPASDIAMDADGAPFLRTPTGTIQLIKASGL